MIKAEVIMKAWLNVFMGITTETHKDRSKICAVCPSAKYNTYLAMLNDEMTEIKGMICDECGCPLSGKIRSTDSCPKDKWR